MAEKEVNKKVKSPIVLLLKILGTIALTVLLVKGIRHSLNGNLIEVLEYLAIGFFATGVILSLLFAISKEAFLMFIGWRHKRALESTKIVSNRLVETLIKYLPIGLNQDEKERIKEDVTFLVEMRFMAGINNFIMRIFIGAFAAAFGLLGTIVLMKQNEKIDVQNEKVNIQNHLMEAERRSSLIFLMSNVLDKVDDEIKEQKAVYKEKRIEITDSTKYSLSKPLIGRIVALSRAFKPYQMMYSDTLSNKLVSPERGQFFIALMSNNLDSVTQNFIVDKGDFSYSIIDKMELINATLRKANLRNARLQNIDLEGANLSDSYLQHSILTSANLKNANLKEALLFNSSLVATDLRNANLFAAHMFNTNLESADLRNANLYGASLNNSNLKKAKFDNANLSYTNLTDTKVERWQLINAKTLYEIKGVPSNLISKLKKEKPCLFNKEGCN